MIATYRNITLPTLLLRVWHIVIVRLCEAEEADQRLARNIFNLINNSWKNTVIRLIDTDVLVLLMLYIRQVQLNDIEIHVCLINSGKYYNIRHHTRTWFWYFPCFTPLLFTECDTVSSFYGKGNCKANVWVSSERKDYFTDVFVELGEKPTDGTSDHIDMLENFMLQLSVLRHDTLGAGRLHKFKKSADKDLHLLPPSKEALRQHIYHASYQAGCLWR